MRGSFFIPLVAALRTAHLKLDTDTANVEVKRWLAETANCRLHQTIAERPCDRFEKEKTVLLPIPKVLYPTQMKKKEVPQLIEFPNIIPELAISQHDLLIYESLIVQGEV